MEMAQKLVTAFLIVTGATVIGIAFLGWVLKPRSRRRRY